jgi:hypothetical protein
MVISKIWIYELLSDNIQFRLNRRYQIIIYVISGVVLGSLLFLTLDPSITLEQNKTLTNFTAAIAAAIIGVVLFVLYRRRPKLRNFFESMPLLILFMSVTGLTIPLFKSYNVSIHYFLPAFLVGLNGWLFFTQHVICGKDNWHTDPSKRWILVPWYMLMGGFFVGTIVLVNVASHVFNWT